MKFIHLCLLISAIFFLTTGVNAQENKINIKVFVDTIFDEYPNLAISLIKNKQVDAKLLSFNKFQRTNYFNSLDKNLLSFKNDQLYLKNKPIVYLAKDKSAFKTKYGKDKKKLIFRWTFDVPSKGSYLIYQASYAGAQGYINKKSALNIGRGIISHLFSGKSFTFLDAGKNTVTLVKNGKHLGSLLLLPAASLNKAKKMVLAKLSSSEEPDVKWVLKYLVSSLSKRGHGCSIYINQIFDLPPYKAFFLKSPKMAVSTVMKAVVASNSYLDTYFLGKQFYANHEELFLNQLFLSNTKIFHRYYFRNIFITRAIFDHQIKSILDIVKKTNAIQKKKLDEQKYLQLVVGRYQQVLEGFHQIAHLEFTSFVQEEIKKALAVAKSKGFKITFKKKGIRSAKDLLISDPTEESLALNTQSIILDYKNGEGSLKTCYDRFIVLKHAIFKRGDRFTSMRNIFLEAYSRNKVFMKDFKKYCKEAVSGKVSSLIKSKKIEDLEEVLSQFSGVLKLPEIHLVLGQYYFKRGLFEKAYYHLSWLAKNVKNLTPKVYGDLMALEDFCDLLPEEDLLAVKSTGKINYQGHQISLKQLGDQLNRNKNYQSNGPGKLKVRIPLPKDHIQYWNHTIKLSHQGVEPRFTKTKLLLTTSNALLCYSLKDGKRLWKNLGSNEYYKGDEPGSHQKRFVSEHSGNNYYLFSNVDYSSRKTIKSFTTSGALNWDISTFKALQKLEPISSPIASGGNLLFLSYDNRQTIKSIGFNMIDPVTGAVKSSIPLSNIPDRFLRQKHWNTYRHDQHFIKEGDDVYGFTGSGVVFKANGLARQLLWGKAYVAKLMPNTGYHHLEFHHTFGYAASGYINIFKNTLVTYMPDIQTLTGFDKNSGKEVWRTRYLYPMHIHGRKSKEALYFSEHIRGQRPWLVKINPISGDIIWKKLTKGLIPQGEGEETKDHLIIPCIKSLAYFDKKTGVLIKKVDLNVQPLKVVYGNDHWVILTKKDAYLLDNSGKLLSAELKRSPFKETGFVKPDAIDHPLPYDSITLEKSIFLPAISYSSPKLDPRLIPTSLLNHHILQRGSHLTLFREGFEQKSGVYVQPGILWYSQIPYYCLLKDRIIISEPGQVRAEDLFTRKIIWTYDYEVKTPQVWYSPNKAPLRVVSGDQYTVFQTPWNKIRVLDTKTQEVKYDFSIGSATSMVIIKNMLITLQGKDIKAFDLDQGGKFKWKKFARHSYFISKDQGMFVCETKGGKPGYGQEYSDPQTGKRIAIFSHGAGYTPTRDGMNTRVFGKQFSITFNQLFDTKTSKPVKKFNEARNVKNGGYFCFPKKGGNQGFYLENGKFYPVHFRGRGDSRNCQFTAIKKGNRIMTLSVYALETFEIQDDKLVHKDFTSFLGAHFGNRDGTSLFSLDNGFLEIRRSQMFFFRHFDPYNKFNAIKSFRVNNATKSNFPYSQLYPEVKILDSQWLSNKGSKPARDISYQAFANRNHAFFHFKLSPLKNSNEKTMMHISANQQSESVTFKWNPDLWDHCTTSFNIHNKVKSWRELDQDGAIHLYITVSLSTFSSKFRRTLPDFSIEFRQYKNDIETGLHRIGSAFYSSKKFFGWDNYVNDQAQTLQNFRLRSQIYHNSKAGFFPQGLELQKWVIDARRHLSSKESIEQLKLLVRKHSKSFCVVNILALLLNEELYNYRIAHPNMLDIDPSFYQQITLNSKKIKAFATTLAIKKEWIDFALTFHTLEIFPSKVTYRSSRHAFYKSFHGQTIGSPKREIIKTWFEDTHNPALHDINNPLLVFFQPALLTGYPKESQIRRFSLDGVEIRNTGVGQLTAFDAAGHKVLWNRDFSAVNESMLIKGKKPLSVIQKIFYFNFKEFKCFRIKSKAIVGSIGFTTPPIKAPSVKADSGLDSSNVITLLENLPSDSRLGEAILGAVVSKNPTIVKDKLKTYISAWLPRTTQNGHVFFSATKFIHRLLRKRKLSDINLYKELFKEAKVPRVLQRVFVLSYFNNMKKIVNISFLGPVKGELNKSPYDSKTIEKIYVAGKKKYSFTNRPKGKAGTFFIAMNVEMPKRKKVYFYLRSTERRANVILSLWLNQKQKIDSASLMALDYRMVAQKLSLKKGKNIIIIKLEDVSAIKDYSISIGDSKGFPIKGVVIKGVH